MADIWTVLIAGSIGAVGPLIALVFQGRQNRERDRVAHKQQLERDAAAHKQQMERDQQALTQQLERDRLEYERSQAEARREQLRAGYAALLEAALAIYYFLLSYGEYSKLTAGLSDFKVPLSEVKQEIAQRSALLRDAMNKLDKATVALLLLEPGVEIIADKLRLALETYVVFVENPMEVNAAHNEKAQKLIEDAKHTIFYQVREIRQTLPERLARLGLPTQSNTAIAPTEGVRNVPANPN